MAAIAELRSNVAQIPDWKAFVETAERHGMMPMVYRSLNAYCAEIAPKTAMRAMQDRFKANALRNLMRTQELLRIVGIFEHAGIAAIPYKGPTLAVAVYGDLALREFSDLDILISPEDVRPAIDLLLSHGYHAETQLNKKQFSAYLRSGCEFGFQLDQGDCRVELHWQIAPAMFSIPFKFQELWVRRQMLSLGEGAVTCLSPEDMLLVFCVHAMKHTWNSLGWIVDVAKLLQSTPLDWKVTLERARLMGIERILLLGLLLASDFFSAPLPQEIKKLVCAKSVRTLGKSAVEKLSLLSFKDEFSLSDHLFFFRSRERLPDKIAYAFRALFTPDLADWQSARLPELMFPLYRILRIGRIFKKFSSTLPRARAGLAPSGQPK